jgi:pantoate--beta-alanine ligase
MSSRNIYLDNRERIAARSLYSALSMARKLIMKGERNPKKVIQLTKQLIILKNKIKIDYIKITEADTLRDLDKIKGKVLIALAAYIGKTRLIDNLVLDVKK